MKFDAATDLSTLGRMFTTLTHRALDHSLLVWPFTLRLFARTANSLLTHCSLHSRTPLRSFVRSLARSLTPERMEKGFLSME